MDNQQERLWSWLGGFIDGEGCFGIYRKNEKSGVYLYPIVDIVNTNPRDIERVAEIVKQFTGCHIDLKGQTVTHKAKWSLRVIGFNRCKAFLPHIIPFLVGKKEEAELLLEFCFSPRDNTVREDFKARLKALKNPQRLYAEPFAHVRMDDKVQR